MVPLCQCLCRRGSLAPIISIMACKSWCTAVSSISLCKHAQRLLACWQSCDAQTVAEQYGRQADIAPVTMIHGMMLCSPAISSTWRLLEGMMHLAASRRLTYFTWQASNFHVHVSLNLQKNQVITVWALAKRLAGRQAEGCTHQ